MIETRAMVVQLEGKYALVESVQGGGCGNCNSESGCGSSKLSQLFGREPRQFRVLNKGNAQVGTLVQVTLPEGVLVSGALLMYIFPLILLLVGAMAGGLWGNDTINTETFSAIGGLLGLVLGFFLVKIISLKQRLISHAQPVILPSTA